MRTTTPLRSKLPNAGVTIFTTMSRLALEHGAINLSQGFPDFNCAPELIDAVARYMRDGHNQYAPMPGAIPLREALSMKIERLYGHRYDPVSEITVTSGATEGLYATLTALVHPGDEVMLFQPAYDSYVPAIQLSGGTPVFVTMRPPDYHIDWDAARRALTPRTRAIVINSPHNPTGAVLQEDDIKQLSAIVNNTDIIIVSDEVYEHLIYDGIQHQSILRYPGLLERSFVCFSFGKTYHCTGWKIGYCVSAPALMKEFRKVHQFNCFSCNSPVQFALAEYLLNEDAYLSLGSYMQKKRDYFRKLMEHTSFKLIPSHGSYFECYSYDAITNEPDKDFAIRLTKEKAVATIPMSSFYKDGTDNKVIRFCFSKKEQTLEEAVSRLLS